MAADVNALLAKLQLVFPPVPNSSVSFVRGDPTAVAAMRRSDFYMIAARAVARFTDFHASEDDGLIRFSIDVPGIGRDCGYVDTQALPLDDYLDENSHISIRYGESLINIYAKSESCSELIASFSPEQVLLGRGRGSPIVGGLDNHLALATYDLLYVGIATETDSFDRLFDRGHHARCQILSDEPQRYPGARVSDEIFIFLFEVNPLLVRSFGPETDIEDSDMIFSVAQKRLVSDAEKAFVSLLRPKYNRTLYKSYPKGKDGFYGTGLTAYSYSISEGFAFRTQYGLMKGAGTREDTFSNDADFISIKGDDVRFHVAGVDFDLPA